VSAASKALDQVGFRLLVSGLQACLTDADEAAAKGFDLDQVEKLFLKLA
jgi:DNA-binding FrmR family transcriptional regulator